MEKRLDSARKFKQTEIGRINREIKKSVSDIFTGSRGAIGETIRLARQQERIILRNTEGLRDGHALELRILPVPRVVKSVNTTSQASRIHSEIGFVVE